MQAAALLEVDALVVVNPSGEPRFSDGGNAQPRFGAVAGGVHGLALEPYPPEAKCTGLGNRPGKQQEGKAGLRNVRMWRHS